MLLVIVGKFEFVTALVTGAWNSDDSPRKKTSFTSEPELGAKLHRRPLGDVVLEYDRDRRARDRFCGKLIQLT